MKVASPIMSDSTNVDLAAAAISVDPPGLRYVSHDVPAIRRKKAGAGFFYLDSKGRRLSDPSVLKRVRALAVPPARTDVWICASGNGHIQATGRDARGRKQYRYHAAYREMREQAKYERLLSFAEALPKIRSTVAEQMGLRGLSRVTVLAAVVHLLETTLVRVGNADYARQNRSYGLTTLKSRHVAVDGSEIRFSFVGKSGKRWSLSIRNRRVAKLIRACQELPGQDLLQYRDDAGELRTVSSGDVNAYLRETTGSDITAKDFRTWAGSVLMVRFLAEIEPFESVTQANRNLRAALARVSASLGNTPTVCRKCYVHPAVLSAYLDGALVSETAPAGAKDSGVASSELRPEELALVALLRAQAKRHANSSSSKEIKSYATPAKTRRSSETADNGHRQPKVSIRSHKRDHGMLVTSEANAS
jgi:DNA topoisomerase-1